jgi:hypothetical protein
MLSYWRVRAERLLPEAKQRRLLLKVFSSPGSVAPWGKAVVDEGIGFKVAVGEGYIF